MKFFGEKFLSLGIPKSQNFNTYWSKIFIQIQIREFVYLISLAKFSLIFITRNHFDKIINFSPIMFSRSEFPIKNKIVIISNDWSLKINMINILAFIIGIISTNILFSGGFLHRSTNEVRATGAPKFSSQNKKKIIQFNHCDNIRENIQRGGVSSAKSATDFIAYLALK